MSVFLYHQLSLSLSLSRYGKDGSLAVLSVIKCFAAYHFGYKPLRYSSVCRLFKAPRHVSHAPKRGRFEGDIASCRRLVASVIHSQELLAVPAVLCLATKTFLL